MWFRYELEKKRKRKQTEKRITLSTNLKHFECESFAEYHWCNITWISNWERNEKQIVIERTRLKEKRICGEQKAFIVRNHLMDACWIISDKLMCVLGGDSNAQIHQNHLQSHEQRIIFNLLNFAFGLCIWFHFYPVALMFSVINMRTEQNWTWTISTWHMFVVSFIKITMLFLSILPDDRQKMLPVLHTEHKINTYVGLRDWIACVLFLKDRNLKWRGSFCTAFISFSSIVYF